MSQICEKAPSPYAKQYTKGENEPEILVNTIPSVIDRDIGYSFFFIFFIKDLWFSYFHGYPFITNPLPSILDKDESDMYSTP